MIKANELRLGNYIETPLGIDAVFSITKIDEQAGINTFYDEEVQPISLTEEWLLKFGFHEMISQQGYFIKSLTLDDEMTLESEDFIFHLPSGKICVDVGMFVHTIGMVILNVHEFQNVFFALTGEELTIK